jgi:hypothetical protein
MGQTDEMKMKSAISILASTTVAASVTVVAYAGSANFSFWDTQGSSWGGVNYKF